MFHTLTLLPTGMRNLEIGAQNTSQTLRRSWWISLGGALTVHIPPGERAVPVDAGKVRECGADRELRMEFAAPVLLGVETDRTEQRVTETPPDRLCKRSPRLRELVRLGQPIGGAAIPRSGERGVVVDGQAKQCPDGHELNHLRRPFDRSRIAVGENLGAGQLTLSEFEPVEQSDSHGSGEQVVGPRNHPAMMVRRGGLVASGHQTDPLPGRRGLDFAGQREVAL